MEPLRLRLRYTADSDDGACIEALRQFAGERGLNQAAFLTLRLGLPLYRQHLLEMVRRQEAGTAPAPFQLIGQPLEPAPHSVPSSLHSPSTSELGPAEPSATSGATAVGPPELSTLGELSTYAGGQPLSAATIAMLKQWD